MKHNWFSSVRRTMKNMIGKITEPQLRRTLYYDCGLYCKGCGRKPVTQIHMEHEYCVPLIKAAGIGILAVGGVWAVSSLMRFGER